MFESSVREVGGTEKLKVRLQRLLRSHEKRIRREQRGLKRTRSKTVEAKGRVTKRGEKEHDNSDCRLTRKMKKLMPEETYEIWHQEKNINKNIYKYLDHHTDNEEEHQAYEEHELGDDVAEEEDAVSSSMDKLNTSAGAHFLIQSQGLEILPFTRTEQPTELHKSLLSKKVSYYKRHIGIVESLLHLSVLRRDWELAYKCFALLIRLPQIDVRSLWPIGVEITTRIAEQSYQEKQQDSNIAEYTLRVFGTHDAPLQVFRDEQFLRWLETFYPINRTLNPKFRYQGLPYRVGSTDSPPFFVLTLLWTLLMKQKFSSVNEKLSELLLRKPYITDGIYHFLQGFSFQIEASTLILKEVIDRVKIEKLMLDSQKCYEEARKLGADFPEKLIQNEFNLIKVRLAGDIENDMKQQDNSPDNENESEDDDSLSNADTGSFAERERNEDSDDDMFD